MVMTASTRKRIRQVETEDLYPSPEFEPGPRPVPEAELQHVSPSAGEQSQPDAEKNETGDIYDEINRRLSVIEDCQGTISEMLSCIDEEKRSIRDLLIKEKRRFSEQQE